MEPFAPLTTTAIGSVPFDTVADALEVIANACPDLPHWPQMVHARPREDMVLQAADRLPLLDVDEAGRRVVCRSEGREQALTEFYEHFLAEDWDYFRIPPSSASGLEPMLNLARQNRGFGSRFLKAQICGPVTMGQSIRTPEGKNLIDDPELVDTVVKGLGAKGAWLAGRILETGRNPLIFLDEPGLTGFGSAFSTLSGDQVRAMLEEVASIVRTAGEVRIGVHVCGNTDWGLLTDCGLDVINFDAFGFMDHFLLYATRIRGFLDRGGYIAWGIVPTLDFSGRETPEGLAGRLEEGWARMVELGIDRSLVVERSLITPACGVGPLDIHRARAVYSLLPLVANCLNAGQ